MKIKYFQNFRIGDPIRFLGFNGKIVEWDSRYNQYKIVNEVGTTMQITECRIAEAVIAYEKWHKAQKHETNKQL